MRYNAFGVIRGSLYHMSGNTITEALVKYVENFGQDPRFMLTDQEVGRSWDRIDRAINKVTRR